MKFRLSRASAVKFEYFTRLENSFEAFMRARWWQKARTVDEIAAMCRLISNARAEFWFGIQEEVPESVDGAWHSDGRHVWKLKDSKPGQEVPCSQ